ncbi:MAG: cyclopropane-fatty-acyl-phospholipid synthase family protein [Rhizomicrobium sp.]
MKEISDCLTEKKWLDALNALEYGTLQFGAPDGTIHLFRAPHPGPKASFMLRDWGVLRRAAERGDIAFGEDYIDGAWDSDDIEALVSLFLINRSVMGSYANGNFLSRMMLMLHNRVTRRNSLTGSKRNIEAHYDVGNDFYRLWLDPSMTYSSALYLRTGENLETAQQNKYRRILDRFARPRADVLEIGCGWGGFAERAVGAGHHVTGLTISPSQHRFAQARLGSKADIRLEDYRKVKGRFDMVVSIEMFEAVGERYWPQYFQSVSERLRRGGRAVIQTIAIRDDLFTAYRMRSDFIRHYVFPGGMLPSLQRFGAEAERAGLKVASRFSFGQDYARTLRDWSVRMQENKGKILGLGHDERFFRNWQYYLNICAAAFRVGRTDVAQVELVKV